MSVFNVLKTTISQLDFDWGLFTVFKLDLLFKMFILFGKIVNEYYMKKPTHYDGYFITNSYFNLSKNTLNGIYKTEFLKLAYET